MKLSNNVTLQEYNKMHQWIRRNWKKTGICEFCHIESKTQWSNKSGKYLKHRVDWQELCPACHGEYDRKVRKAEIVPTDYSTHEFNEHTDINYERAKRVKDPEALRAFMKEIGSLPHKRGGRSKYAISRELGKRIEARFPDLNIGDYLTKLVEKDLAARG